MIGAKEGPALRGNEEQAEQSPNAESVLPTLPFDRERVMRRDRLRREWDRSRSSRQLDALIAAGREPAPPSTYGLNGETRRQLAAALMKDERAPWQQWEIRARFASPEVRA